MPPTTSTSSSFVDFLSRHSTLLIAIGIGLLLVIAIVLVISWRRRRSRGAAPSSPSLSQRLESVWQPFYRGLPRHARHFSTVIVVGEAGAGKSRLVDTHVDWRGQSHQFLPGAAQGELLQIYLGPDVIVHELSTTLLRDTSAGARRALSKLWRRLARGPAVVIVVVNAHDLAVPRPDALRSLAQLVRGKLRLIASRRPVELRVCLTHLDQMVGYQELAHVLGTHTRGLALDQAWQSSADGVAAQLEARLASALVRQRHDEFRRMVGFCQSFPARFAALAPFLRSLAGDEPFAPRYRLDSLCLSAAGRDGQIGQPFAVSRAAVLQGLRVSRRRHAAASLALGGSLAAALIGVGLWHARHVGQAERAVDALVTRAQDQGPSTTANTRPGTVGAGEIDAAEQIAATEIARLHQSEHLWLDRSFVPRKQRLRLRFLDTVRQRYLLPRIRPGASQVELLYATALIYAARDTELGALVQGQAERWAARMAIPVHMVEDYVGLSEQPWTGRIDLPAPGASPAALEAADWRPYLGQLAGVLGQERMAPAELEALLARTPIVSDGDELRLLASAADLLGQDPALRGRLAPVLAQPRDSAWVREHHADLAAVTEMVRRAHLRVPSVAGWPFARLVREIQVVSLPAGPYPRYEFIIEGETFAIDAGAWESLLARSRSGLMLDAFLADMSGNQREPFLPATLDMPDEGAVSEVPNQGPSEVIRGPYTRAAFDAYVAPVLHAFDQEESVRLPLGPADRARLESLVHQSAAAYARGYGRELESYYRSFRFEVTTPAALAPALSALIQPSSPLVAFLRTVARQATLDGMGEGAAFAPLRQSVAPFAPVIALVAEDDKGNLPHLEPYQKIIAALLPVAATPAPAPAPAGAEAAADAGLPLSALGTLAMQAMDAPDQDQREAVRLWLIGVDVYDDWQQPFLAPVQRVYRLGTANIEAEAERAWRRHVRPLVSDLLDHVPFRRDARTAVSAAEIEQVLRAQGKEPGSFWLAFQQYLGSVTTRDRNGRWHMRGHLGAPDGMLAMVNALARVSEELWDGDGNRVPITLQLTPRPLPRKSVDGHLATLGYLDTGSTSAHAFNQRPEARSFTFPWWDQTSASVGVMLSEPDGDSQAYSIDVVQSDWSLYRLFQQGRLSEDLELSWRIPITDSDSIRVRFVLNLDPWSLFRVPGATSDSGAGAEGDAR
ncbi:MAG TPA: ImcF-related family protein [Haliangium sp.]|nr:ImcF-related family protein [Haliangium sp.]